MTRNHKLAACTLAAAATADALLGVAFACAQHIGVWTGLYFATTTGTTVGYGDVTPHGWAPHLIAVGLMVIAVPLFGASFALFSAGLVSLSMRRIEGGIRKRIDSCEMQIREHVSARLRHHLGDAPVEGGSGTG